MLTVGKDRNKIDICKLYRLEYSQNDKIIGLVLSKIIDCERRIMKLCR